MTVYARAFDIDMMAAVRRGDVTRTRARRRRLCCRPAPLPP